MMNDEFIARPKPLVAAFKIWIAGVALGPVLLYLWFSVEEIRIHGWADYHFEKIAGLYAAWLALVLLGALFSFPSALVLWLALRRLNRCQQSDWGFLATVLAITFLLTLAPAFVVLGGWKGGHYGRFLLALPYLLAAWIGVWWAFRKWEQVTSDPGR